MTRTLVVANPKGGVGKTTTTLNLGAAFAARSERVLLVDLDPQAGLTLALAPRALGHEAGFFGLLTHRIDRFEAALLRPGEGLALLPACAELAYLESRIGSRREAVYLLREVLRSAQPGYDTILIDTPPGVDLLLANALVAADGVLVTVQAQLLAMYGVRTLQRAVQHVRAAFNPALRLSGLLATMVLPRSGLNQDVVGELRAVFPQKTLKTVIPFSETLVEAQIAGKSILAYAPEDPAAGAYSALAEEIGPHE